MIAAREIRLRLYAYRPEVDEEPAERLPASVGLIAIASPSFGNDCDHINLHQPLRARQALNDEAR